MWNYVFIQLLSDFDETDFVLKPEPRVELLLRADLTIVDFVATGQRLNKNLIPNGKTLKTTQKKSLLKQKQFRQNNILVEKLHTLIISYSISILILNLFARDTQGNHCLE